MSQKSFKFCTNGEISSHLVTLDIVNNTKIGQSRKTFEKRNAVQVLVYDSPL